MMLQRCHVCGRVDEACKPCQYCGWWFCEKHIDPEQHECTGLKTLRQSRAQRGEKISASLERSPFLGLGLLFLAFSVMLGARPVSYTGVEMEKELCRETLVLEPYSVEWFSVQVTPHYPARIKNLNLSVSASEYAYRRFSLMVYALKPEETAGFSEWWARIEKHGIYEEPNFSKALHDAKNVSGTTAMVPVKISGPFELYFILLNSNPDKTVSIMVSASLTWLKPESVSLSYSLDSPGLYAGLPLAILGAYFLVWYRRGESLDEHSPRWTRILDSLTFAAILLLPFALYFSTEKDWDNSTVFMLNSNNPINALSPEFLSVFAMVLQSILLHEYGHFAAARAMGLKAEIIAAKELNVFATTRISAERPVTVREFLRIRRMGPVSNLLLAIMGLPFLLLNMGTVFFGTVFWNLVVLSWNWKELSIPAEEESGGAGRRRIIKDSSLFPNMAEKYVKTAGRRLGVKLDYSLDSLKTLSTVTSKFMESIQDSGESRKYALILHALQTASYLGEVIVRNLDGKWVEAKNLLGWAVSLDGEKIDVYAIALESMFTPTRFNELYGKLVTAGNQESSPSFS